MLNIERETTDSATVCLWLTRLQLCAWTEAVRKDREMGEIWWGEKHLQSNSNEEKLNADGEILQASDP